uniref:Uncharacterized protein n=1 Tax=Arundo donax TaxID=35708 RepID=A0A0A9FRD5_ARUDO
MYNNLFYNLVFIRKRLLQNCQHNNCRWKAHTTSILLKQTSIDSRCKRK